MKFHEQYHDALNLLPAGLRDYFRDQLVGVMAHSLGALRREQCLEAALFLVQNFEPEKERKMYLVK